MMRRVITVLVIIACLVATGFAWLKVRSLQGEIRDNAVVHANELAAKDTAIVRLTVLHDSQVAVTRRLAYQANVDIQAAYAAFSEMFDSVQVLGVALAEFQVRGDSLERELVGRDAEVDAVGTITVEGELDAREDMGVSVRASVAIPATLESPTWNWFVAREPLSLTLGIQCEGTQAVAYATGPAWASIALDSVVQDDRICNPLPTSWRPFEVKVPSVPVGLAIFGLGAYIGSKVGGR